MRTSTFFVRLVTGAIAIVGLSCSNGTEPDPQVEIMLTGRLERSSVVSVAVSRDGALLQPTAFTLSFAPADGAQLNSDGTITLLKPGSLQITATAGTDAGTNSVTVARPPLVVFDLTRSGARHIWQVAIDGGDLEALTTVGSSNEHPSRVGNTLVYAGARDSRSLDIYLRNITTGTETRLTNGAAGIQERNPNLSANGQRITYVTSEFGGVDRARYFNSSGTAGGFVADISSDPNAIETTPAWAPDSERIIFGSTTGGGAIDLFIANTPGGVAAKLNAATNTMANPELSPAWNAANQIAFFRAVNNVNNEIWITNPTGTPAARLTDGASPSWLPDGRLVFVRFSQGTGSLHWIDPAIPSVVVPINNGGGSAQNPSAVRP